MTTPRPDPKTVKRTFAEIQVGMQQFVGHLGAAMTGIGNALHELDRKLTERAKR